MTSIRLEYIGDKVLGLVIFFLNLDLYPDLQAGPTSTTSVRRCFVIR